MISEDHFTVDGTLIRSLASHKSIEAKDGRTKAAKAQQRQNDDDDPDQPGSGGRDALRNWRGQKLSNAMHHSRKDPEALLARKGFGKEAQLCHHVEREHALEMLDHVRRRHRLRPKTTGFDAGYDDGAFLCEVERRDITPHVPVRKGPIRARDEAGQARRRARRRATTAGYRLSQRVRKRVEQIIGWGKTKGQLARTRFLGHERIELEAMMTGVAYNLLRMTRLAATT